MEMKLYSKCFERNQSLWMSFVVPGHRLALRGEGRAKSEQSINNKSTKLKSKNQKQLESSIRQYWIIKDETNSEFQAILSHCTNDVCLRKTAYCAVYQTIHDIYNIQFDTQHLSHLSKPEESQRRNVEDKTWSGETEHRRSPGKEFNISAQNCSHIHSF